MISINKIVYKFEKYPGVRIYSTPGVENSLNSQINKPVAKQLCNNNLRKKREGCNISSPDGCDISLTTHNPLPNTHFQQLTLSEKTYCSNLLNTRC